MSASFGGTNGPPRPMNSYGFPSHHPALPMEAVGKVNRRAQLQGLRDGLFGGALGASFMHFFLRRSANVTVMTGLGASCFVAYVSGYAHVRRGLADLERSMIATRGQDEMNRLDLKAGENKGFDAGVAGMHEFVDRGQSTRGDH